VSHTVNSAPHDTAAHASTSARTGARSSSARTAARLSRAARRARAGARRNGPRTLVLWRALGAAGTALALRGPGARASAARGAAAAAPVGGAQGRARACWLLPKVYEWPSSVTTALWCFPPAPAAGGDAA